MFDMPWFLGQIKRGYNPEQIMMNVLEQRMGGTPMGDNLISLARQGNTKEIEKIARNLASQRGMDFDKEFNAFRKQFGL
jgi:hypothetical protein